MNIITVTLNTSYCKSLCGGSKVFSTTAKTQGLRCKLRYFLNYVTHVFHVLVLQHRSININLLSNRDFYLVADKFFIIFHCLKITFARLYVVQNRKLSLLHQGQSFTKNKICIILYKSFIMFTNIYVTLTVYAFQINFIITKLNITSVQNRTGKNF